MTASASALPAGTPGYVAHMPPAKAGGSSVQIEAPCFPGTLRLKAYPDGNGVAATAVLRNTDFTKLYTWAYVTPYDAWTDEGDLPGVAAKRTARSGNATFATTNLTESTAIGGYTHRWPQTAEVDLAPLDSKMKSQPGASCGTAQVYLDSTEARAQTTHLVVNVERKTGAVAVRDVTAPGAGDWQVTVTAHSPAGVQHQTRSVAGRRQNYYPHWYLFRTSFKGFTNLRNFTSVTVTASRDGKDRTWLTLTRTP